MGRFDNEQLLERWATTGQFPEIHSGICAMVGAYARGDRVLDLGCCYGLLAARLRTAMPLTAVEGVDANPTTIQRAKDAGVPVKFHQLRVTLKTLPELVRIIVDGKLNVLVGRRVMPELWEAHPEQGKIFSKAIAEAGIREVFLEGRVFSKRATSALAHLWSELALFAGEYDVRARTGALAYLRVRE